MADYQPTQKAPTVGTILRCTKPLWHTGKVVIMDSGFCVLDGLKALYSKGVFSSAQIKKRRYWPKNVPGDAIVNHFDQTKDMTDVDELPGMLGDCQFHIVAMKEPNYVSMMMTTFGMMEEVENHKTRREWKEPGSGLTRSKTFNYQENFSLYFHNRHQIDDHNNRRQSPISIEKTWGTKEWQHHVFAFILAVTEVNVLRWKECVDDEYLGMPQLKLRRKLVFMMIKNTLDGVSNIPELTRHGRKRISEDHRLQAYPKNTGQWLGNWWEKVKTDYLQRICPCQKSTRLHCQCNKMELLCHNCFTDHLTNIINE